MNVYVGNRLPSTYQEVEWIQGTGSQYINTGFVPNQNSKAEFMVSNLISGSGGHNIFGADKGRQNSGFSIYYGQYGAQAGQVSFGSAGYHGGENCYIADGNIHAGTLSKDGYYVDGTLCAGPWTYTFTSVNLYLFALNRNGSAIEYSNSGRIHYIKLYNNGTLVRNFVPCYRKSDSVIGLYDLVNSAFYTNAGSGTFSKGNDVTMSELKNAYIGEFVPYTPGENTIARYQFKSDIANHYGNDADWYIHSGSVSYENNMMKHTGELRKNKATLSGGYSGNFTVLSWRKREGTDARIDLWRYDFSMNSGMSIPGGNAELCSVYAGGLWYAISLPQMTNGVHLFAMVRSGNTLYGYLDGNLIGSKSISGSLNSTLTCGAMSGAGGTVGETIAENKAWSQTGIQDYYNNTKSNYGL